MAEIKNGILHATNAEIFNTIRNYAPSDYQSRVPAVTQATIGDAISALNDYTPDWNVFYNILLNRIATTLVRQKSFTNPLAQFKRSSIKYGTQIQEMQVNLLRAKSYDKNAMNIYGLEGREPDIHVKYHTMNRRDKYEITLPMEQVLSGAFDGSEDLAALLNSCLAQPMNSDQNDEFILMLNLFKHYQDFTGFYNVQIDPITDADSARKLVKAVRVMNTNLRYYSTDYSAEGRNAGLSTLSDSTMLLIDANVDATLTVDMLAYMFNSEDGKLIADRIIRVPKLPVAGASAFLVDTDFLLCADNIPALTLTAPINPQNMTQPVVMHHWETLSYSLFTNAIMFSTLPDTDVTRLESTVTGVTLTDAEGRDSGTVMPTLDTRTGYASTPAVKLLATVKGNNSPSQAVRYELRAFNGRGRGIALPANCYVDSTGTLHAGAAKAGTVIKVTATSIQNEQFSATYTATVEGVKVTTGLTSTPAAITVKVDESTTAKVAATPQDATDAGFTVAVVTGADNVGVSVDRVHGTYTVTGIKQGAATLVLSATGAGDTPVTKTVAVTVNPKM
jgi:hypothetical protein